jgi:CheY-like chemotaxis protein
MSPLVNASRRTAARRAVVVVEDDADIRELLAELLREAGHDVTAAEDGPKGLEAILVRCPHVAFVDLGLPGFDGLELARRARSSGSTSRLVALTGYGQSEDKKRAADAGFDEHLTKPITAVEIERALRKAG